MESVRMSQYASQLLNSLLSIMVRIEEMGMQVNQPQWFE
jgi:hypothetical protein